MSAACGGIGKTRNGEIGNEKPGNGWKCTWKLKMGVEKRGG